MREHCAGQRAQAAQLADEHRHLGSDRRGRDEALWLHAVLSGAGFGRALHPGGPVLSFLEAREYDFATRFIELAGEVNTEMPYHVVNAVANALNDHKKSMKGSKILVLGVAYKKDVDDLRESPTLKIMQLLQQRGAAL